jgi:hypothetical protein
MPTYSSTIVSFWSIKPTWNHLPEFTLLNIFQSSCELWHANKEFEKDVVWNEAGERPLNTFDFFGNFLISSCKILLQAVLFFKTDMDNPSSNSTWSKVKFTSTERYHNWSIPVLYAFLNAMLCETQNSDLFRWAQSRQVIHPNLVSLASFCK